MNMNDREKAKKKKKDCSKLKYMCIWNDKEDKLKIYPTTTSHTSSSRGGRRSKTTIMATTILGSQASSNKPSRQPM